MPLLRIPDAESVDVIPVPQRVGRLLEALRLARERDLPVNIKPVLLMLWR